MSRPIKHAVIVCHPAENSFTQSVARRYVETVQARGQEVIVRDLYRLGFDPVLRVGERHGEPATDVEAEWAELGEPDVFVLVYPIWFGAPPAMLIGYIDRVFGAGRQRGSSGDEGPGNLLAGKHLASFSSSGSMRAWLNEKGVLMSLRNVYDRYLMEVFGFAETARYHRDGIGADLPQRDVEQHLFQVEKDAREVMSRFQPSWQMPG